MMMEECFMAISAALLLDVGNRVYGLYRCRREERSLANCAKSTTRSISSLAHQTASLSASGMTLLLGTCCS